MIFAVSRDEELALIYRTELDLMAISNSETLDNFDLVKLFEVVVFFRNCKALLMKIQRF